MLRKRGADAGARGPWALDFSGLTDSPGSGEDRIAAVHTTAAQENAPAEGCDAPSAGDSPPPEQFPAAMFGLGMLDAVDLAVDAAATQFMSKAMRFMSLETSPPRPKASPAASPPSPSSPAAAAQATPPSGQRQRARRSASPASSHPTSPLIKLDTSLAFLDKGLDAINGVGRLVEGFAVSLDNVIGQALDDWAPAAPAAPGREPKKKVVKPVGVLPTPPPAAGVRGQPKDDWGDFDVEEGDEGGPCSSSTSGRTVAPRRERSTPGAAATPGAPAAPSSALPTTSQTAAKEIQQWRRRAQILQKELQKLRAQRDEYLKVKEEYEALQRELREGGGAAAPPTDAPPGTPADPLAAEQVMRQMEALVAEKARLAAENDRLLRENSGLHELLEFTMQQHVANLGEDELFADGAEGSGECEGAFEEEDSFCSAADGGSALTEESE